MNCLSVSTSMEGRRSNLPIRSEKRERERESSTGHRCFSVYFSSPIPGESSPPLTQSIWKITSFDLLCFHREVMLEKQLTGHRVDRSICAWFWDQADSFKVLLFPHLKSFNLFSLLIQLCVCVWLDSHFQWLLHQRITFFKSFVMASLS